MDSKITINIVEPGSGPTPAPVVPNTGLFTGGTNGPEATIITAISVVLILTIVAIVITSLLYRKQKKSGKVTKLVHLVDSTKAVLKSKKRITAGLSAIALLDLTIEVGDQPVFAVLPVELTVEEATQAGYTLTAYADSTDLVSTTDESKVIPMVAVDEGELAALADNTYGLALTEPASQAEEVYTTLSTDADAPTFITDKDHKATEAGDTTTIYYGFYITPEVPYGTYTGSDIYYDVEENDATILTFDGNNSDGGEEMESITVLAGGSIALPLNTYTKTGYKFVGWNTNEAGTGQAYTDGAEYTAVEGGFAEVTLYAQWEELCPANSICYNANGANTGDNDPKMSNQSASSSTDTTLWASNFKYDTNGDGGNDYGFAGWSKDKNAASKINSTGSDKPTIYGPNQTITTGDLGAEGMKLYAVWIAPTNENSTLQGFVCPSNTDMPIGNVIALKDNRDNQVYTVAKLADGNCWMAENLRLADTHKEGGQTVTTTITSSNTHNPASGFTALAASSDEWCTQTTQECIDQSKLNTSNTVNTVVNMTSTNSNIHSYGNYYNWYSAMAGNGKYNSSDSLEGDICPNGWRLPRGGESDTSGSFYYLNNLLNNGGVGADANRKWRSFPNNFINSHYWAGLSRDSGESGHYWSATRGNNDIFAYSLVLNSGGSGIYPGTSTYGVKFLGYMVRCVAIGQ